MALPQKDFLDLVMARTGLTKTKVGAMLGMDSGYSTLHKRYTHQSKLTYTETMTLLSAAGLLQPEAEAAWSGVTLQEAEAAVAEARAAATAEAAKSLAAREELAQGKRKSA